MVKDVIGPSELDSLIPHSLRITIAELIYIGSMLFNAKSQKGPS